MTRNLLKKYRWIEGLNAAHSAEVLLIEKPIVRSSVAHLASEMARRSRDFALLRGPTGV